MRRCSRRESPETSVPGRRDVWRGRLGAETGVSSPADDVPWEVFTYVVVLQAGGGRATLPITICANPAEAEHAARVVAYLELVVLGQGSEGGPEAL
jgi:hypothetical protein